MPETDHVWQVDARHASCGNCCIILICHQPPSSQSVVNSPRQAYEAIDGRIFGFIAGAIPLGVAMQITGTASLPAGWLGNGVGGWLERLILLALFAVDAIITQSMSVAATTALFAPVAVALALGRAPKPFVVTVAMASVIAFLTPYWSSWQSFWFTGPDGIIFAIL